MEAGLEARNRCASSASGRGKGGEGYGQAQGGEGQGRGTGRGGTGAGLAAESRRASSESRDRARGQGPSAPRPAASPPGQMPKTQSSSRILLEAKELDQEGSGGPRGGRRTSEAVLKHPINGGTHY